MQMKEKFCSVCKVGSPSLLIGYKSSGTCLDYAYKKMKIPYTFAFEIYTDEEQLPEMEKNMSYNSRFLEKKIKIRNKNLKLLKKELLMGQKSHYTYEENDLCLSLFNPTDKTRYNYIIDNWTKVDLFKLGY